MAKKKVDDNTDKKLREQVRSVIENDKDLRGYGLNTDVVEGHAQVQGIVDTLKEKERVREISRQTTGIKGVSAAVSISTDGAITDSDVVMEVEQELNSAGIDLKQIGAKTAGHGTVILKGRTNDSSKIEVAKEAASKARGVTEVISQVKLGEEELSMEKIFHSQVNNDNE